MKLVFGTHLILIVVALAGGFSVRAQTPPPSGYEKQFSEITELRRDLSDAIKTRDNASLKTIYADDFTHTHASGQVDGKTERIAALVSGEPTIESAEVSEVNIRFYGKTTAVAVGQSTVKSKGESATKYRWTIVYVKTGRNWRIAASQATRLADK